MRLLQTAFLCGSEARGDPNGYSTSEGVLEIMNFDAEAGGTVDPKLTDVAPSEVLFGDGEGDVAFKEHGRTWCVDTKCRAELKDADFFDEDDDDWNDDTGRAAD